MDDGSTERLPLRDRYTAFIARHEAAWELAMAGLAVVFVVVGFVADDAPPAARPSLELVDASLTVIFALEFASRFAASRNRARYLRAHLIDLVALVPTIRGVRLLRLLRLLRLVRAFTGVARAAASLEHLANHRGLVWLFAAWGGVMVLCSLALYAAENGFNEAVTSPLDALWWGITTMTTVGYGDVYPKTAEGRLAAGVLMVLGIGLYSAITATVTSFMLSDGSQQSVAGDLERVRVLYAEGALTDQEYVRAKDAVLGKRADGPMSAAPTPGGVEQERS